MRSATVKKEKKLFASRHAVIFQERLNSQQHRSGNLKSRVTITVCYGTSE